MTKQEIYDKVCAHLAQQGGPAKSNVGCAYRGDGGRSCAVGCLITDAAYNKSCEGYDATHDGVHLMLRDSGISPTKELVGMLRDLQEDHDNYSYGPDELKAALAYHATKHGVMPGAEQAITIWE